MNKYRRSLYLDVFRELLEERGWDRGVGRKRHLHLFDPRNNIMKLYDRNFLSTVKYSEFEVFYLLSYKKYPLSEDHNCGNTDASSSSQPVTKRASKAG